MNLYNIILAPRVTEKSTLLAAQGQYVFRVKKDATKPHIKEAVQKMFNVQVDAVRVCNTHGKERKFGKTIGRRQSWKKAYVMLKEGHAIKFD